MSRFIQIHMLTSYPPANLNRDDQGRPKTAKMGGVDRLRVSSQSLKRHWRASEQFESSLAENMGKRTKLFGVDLFLYFIKKEQPFKTALDWTQKIAAIYGKLESPVDLKKKKDDEKGKKEKEALFSKLKKKWAARDKDQLGIPDYSLEQLNELTSIEIAQLAFVSPNEEKDIYALADKLIAGEKDSISKDDLKLLRNTTQAVDIALFGRMLADDTANNIEAACQVAHAISVHPVVIEDDYFTAVDDLNDRSLDAGSAHIGETGFAAGLFYSYICINKQLLVENLDGNETLADKAIKALTEAAIKVPPSGKQNSFAHQSYASYVLAECGNQQPRSLSVAYLKPIDRTGKKSEDHLTQAIAAIRKQHGDFVAAYGDADPHYEISVSERKGKLPELLEFITGQAS